MLKAKQIQVGLSESEAGSYLINAYDQKQQDIRRAIVKQLLRGAPSVVLMCHEKDFVHYLGSLYADGFTVVDLTENVIEVSLPFNLGDTEIASQRAGAGL